MRPLISFAILILVNLNAWSAQVTRVDSTNWSIVPQGRQIDACYGDYVMSNEIMSAVVADSRADRLGNTAFPNCSGLIIDYTRIADQNDFMVAFSPGDVRYNARFDDTKVGMASGADVTVLSSRKATASEPVQISTEYKLSSGQSYVVITTTIKNTSASAVQRECFDRLRVDANASQTITPEGDAVWTYNEYSNAAYAVYYANGGVAMAKDTVFYTHGAKISYSDLGPALTGTQFTLQPGQQITWSCALLTGRDQIDLLGQLLALRGKQTYAVKLTVADTSGDPIANADLTIQRGGQTVALGRTNAQGIANLVLESGQYAITVDCVGNPSVTSNLDVPGTNELNITMQEASGVDVEVTDTNDQPLPAKVQFLAANPSNDPNLGPGCLTYAMKNLAMTPTGKVRQGLPPGSYSIVMSHGPEYDAATQSITVTAGQFTSVKAKLAHVVDTTGYISADLHGHTVHSGDNSAEGTGRVMSLVVEGVEFAPSTDHTRIVDWQPFVDELGVQPWIKVCMGEEISGPGANSHQNSWPLTPQMHEQSNGGIVSGGTLDQQVKRIADKEPTDGRIIAFNHPGFDLLSGSSVARSLFNASEAQSNPLSSSGMARGWIDAINGGMRWTGLMNTDSHTTFHGSGYRRNWIISPTDDPAQITPADVVRNVKQGHVICSTGPFMKVNIGTAWAGDECMAVQGKVTLHVQVQCPNWLDINHVAVLGNGAAIPSLDFTRSKNPSMFGNGVVKFDQDLEVTLARDTHLIVVAVGEGLKMTPVMGGRSDKGEPYVFSNPIYVDVDGGGYGRTPSTRVTTPWQRFAVD